METFGHPILYFMSILLALTIIIVNIFSVYYGTRCWVCGYAKSSWFYKSTTVISLMWVLLFSYILIRTCIGNPVLEYDEFGAIVIRPMILLASTDIAISQKMRFERAKFIYGGENWEEKQDN